MPTATKRKIIKKPIAPLSVNIPLIKNNHTVFETVKKIKKSNTEDRTNRTEVYPITIKDKQTINIGEDDLIMERVAAENMAELELHPVIDGNCLFIATEQRIDKKPDRQVIARALINATCILEAIKKFEVEHGKFIWLPEDNQHENQIGVQRIIDNGFIIRLQKIRKENMIDVI